MIEISSEGLPASGQVTAQVIVLAASLLEVAAEHSRASWSEAPGAVAQARSLARRAAALAAENAATYAGARAALAGGPAEPGDGARHDFNLGRALAAAADPPMALSACAADVAQLAVTLSERGEPEVVADVVVAAKLAAAAADAAAHLVEINLVVGADADRVSLARHRARLAAAAAQAALSDAR